MTRDITAKQRALCRRYGVSHLSEWCPSVLPCLGLPPGWRFLIAPDYEDVWQDPTLLYV